jgi:hypothetical protein
MGQTWRIGSESQLKQALHQDGENNKKPHLQQGSAVSKS